ncbi:hypothetical protein [Actinoplanes sp. NPDC020271]|uniref:hypothetical protein n=1 Tax=Actinoplanes sp. NPDC020271 TaxID=3363896 RepID=UPI003793505A
MRSRGVLLGSGIALVVAGTLAAWWGIGDMTDPDLLRQGIEPDYGYEPITFGATGDRLIGIVACVVAVAAAVLLLGATVTRRLRAAWWFVLVPLVVTGLLAALVQRVLTAGVIGGNIGGGLLAMAATPIMLALVATAVAVASRLSRPRHPAWLPQQG